MEGTICVVVVCAMCSLMSGICAMEVDVRLVDGRTSSQGRVMVKDVQDQGNDWKPLCAKYFGENEARVICRQLGFRYSLNEPNIYMSRIPDWIVDSTSCNGNETNIGQCFHGRHDCFHKSDSYAAVCCSNSSEFGDWKEGMFISHCADSWLGAQERCEQLGTSISIHNDVNDAVIDTIDGGFIWNGHFFTPWIWANGCVRYIRSGSQVYLDYVIPYNSPGLCYQRCGDVPGTNFALSGTVCRCVFETTSIENVKPGYCKSRCAGNMDHYCGDNTQTYWDLYRIGYKDSEFAVYSSFPNDTRQCAGLIQSPRGNHKLRSQQCTRPAGYICSAFKGADRPGYIPFSSPPMTLSMARHACRDKTTSWKLVGRDVMDATLYASLAEGIWVDIESSLVPIYMGKDFNVSHSIDPERCQAITFVNYTTSGPRVEIFDCHTTRLLYTCSHQKTTDTTRTTSPISQPGTTTLSIVIADEPGSSPQTVVTQDFEVWEIAIAVLVALVLAMMLVAGFVCWRQRKRRLRATQGDGRIPGSEPNEASYYSALDPSLRSSGQYDLVRDEAATGDTADPAKQPLNLYEEIPDTNNSNNIYLELEAEPASSVEDDALKVDEDVIHDTNDDMNESSQSATDTVDEFNEVEVELRKHPNGVITNNKTGAVDNDAIRKKESVKLKTSYATPMDSIRERPSVKRVESNAADPKYAFPYDSVERLNKEGAVNEKIVEEKLVDS